MRNTPRGRLVKLVVAISLLGTVGTLAGAQIKPPKRPAVDSSKRNQPADTSRPRAKASIGQPAPSKRGVAAGEVALPTARVPQAAVDSAVAAERRAGDMRAVYAREAQRTLDSIASDAQLRRTVDAMKAELVAEREQQRADSEIAVRRAEREAAEALRLHLERGFYAGVAAGMSAPRSNLRQGYTNGWNATIPVGWDDDHSPFGVRADLSVDRLTATKVGDVLSAIVASRDVTVWSLNADAKVRKAAPGAPSRTNFYLVAGLGLHRVVDGVYGVSGPNAGSDLKFDQTKMSFGWNAGGGVSVAWGTRELFIESRLVEVKSDLAYNANGGVGRYMEFTPIVVGFQWF